MEFNFGGTTTQPSSFSTSFQPSSTNPFNSSFPSSFGSNPTNNNPSTGFGFGSTTSGFGTNPTTNNPSSGFSFGNTNTNTNTNTAFSFGQTNPATNTFGAPSSTSGFSFGSTQPTNTAQSSGFGFGQPASNSSSGFGDFNFGSSSNTNNNTSSGGFGSGFNFGTTTNQPAASTNTFGFGPTTTNPAPSTNTGFGFGFGSNPSTTQPSNTFSFGQNANPTTTTQPASGFGFGTSSQPATSDPFSFGFGGTSNQPSTSTNLFGSGTSTGFGFGTQPPASNNQNPTPSEPQGPFQPPKSLDAKGAQDGHMMNIVASPNNKVGNNPEYFSPEEFRIKFMIQQNMLPKLNPAIAQSMLQLPQNLVQQTQSFGFGSQPAATNTNTFGFGTTSQPAASNPSNTFSFGSQPQATGTDSAFNFGFGSQPTTTQPQTSQPASSGFNFGAPTTTNQPSTSTGFDFSFGGSTNTNNQSTGSGFSFGNSAPATTNTGFSFGQPTNTNPPPSSSGFSFDFTKPDAGAATQPATTGGFDFNFGTSSSGSNTFNFGAPTPTPGTATNTQTGFGNSNLFDFTGGSSSYGASNVAISDPSIQQIYSHPFGTFSSVVIQGQQRARDAQTPSTPAAENKQTSEKERNSVSELLKRPAFGSFSNTMSAQRNKGVLSLREKLFFQEEEETPLQILKLEKKAPVLGLTAELKAQLMNETNVANFSRGTARPCPTFLPSTPSDKNGQTEKEETEETSQLQQQQQEAMFSKTLPVSSKPNGILKPTPKRPEPEKTQTMIEEDISDDENEDEIDIDHEDSRYHNENLNFAPKLTKEGYYTVPALSELSRMSESELSRVKDFRIGKKGVGEIKFPNETDLRFMDLDEIIVFGDAGYAEVYPSDKFSEKPTDDSIQKKPEIGKGLNKDAIVQLLNIKPKKNNQREKFVEYLKKNCEKMVNKSKFIDYEPETGKWTFSVAHF